MTKSGAPASPAAGAAEDEGRRSGCGGDSGRGGQRLGGEEEKRRLEGGEGGRAPSAPARAGETARFRRPQGSPRLRRRARRRRRRRPPRADASRAWRRRRAAARRRRPAAARPQPCCCCAGCAAACGRAWPVVPPQRAQFDAVAGADPGAGARGLSSLLFSHQRQLRYRHARQMSSMCPFRSSVTRCARTCAASRWPLAPRLSANSARALRGRRGRESLTHRTDDDTQRGSEKGRGSTCGGLAYTSRRRSTRACAGWPSEASSPLRAVVGRCHMLAFSSNAPSERARRFPRAHTPFRFPCEGARVQETEVSWLVTEWKQRKADNERNDVGTHHVADELPHILVVLVRRRDARASPHFATGARETPPYGRHGQRRDIDGAHLALAPVAGPRPARRGPVREDVLSIELEDVERVVAAAEHLIHELLEAEVSFLCAVAEEGSLRGD